MTTCRLWVLTEGFGVKRTSVTRSRGSRAKQKSDYLLWGKDKDVSADRETGRLSARLHGAARERNPDPSCARVHANRNTARLLKKCKRADRGFVLFMFSPQ